ncbi:hypothetical protein C0991_004908 [Blastosporella zonata]|nr:hypothetical protein C0991_004908 [Blastosporella zonata]
MSASLALRSLTRVSSKCAAAAGLRSLHASSRLSEQYAKADLATYNKVVEVKDRLVLVDFYADWCGPCHALSPILEKIATDPSVQSGSGLPIDLVKIDTDNEELVPLAQKYSIRSLPTVVAFRNGEPVNQFIGALNEAGVKRFLQGV